MKNKPLGAFNYIKNNKMKTVPIIICSMLCVYFTYVFAMFVKATFLTDDYLLNTKKSFSLVYTVNEDSKIDDDLINRINNESSTEKVIKCDFRTTNFNSVMGGDTGISIIKAKTEDIKYMFNNMNLKLKSGRLPRNAGEIILNERLVKCKSLKIGDEIGDEINKNEWLRGSYKLVGIIGGDNITGFIPDNNIGKDTIYALAVFHKKDKLYASNDFLVNNIKSKQIKVNTYKDELEATETSDSTLKVIFNIVQVIVVIVMTLAIGNLSYVRFFHRRKEFGILHAIGCSRRFIIKRVFAEVSFVQAIGYSIGILLSIITGALLKYNLFDNKGLPFEIISSQYFIETIVIPILMSIFNIIPIYRMLKKVDSVSIIQGLE